MNAMPAARTALTAIAVLTLSLSPGTVSAAGSTAVAATIAVDYPAKAIRLIVPYGVGGNADLVARILGQRLGDSLGCQILVDNRPGAGGNVGAEIAARAAPDGYTLVIGTNTHAGNMSLYRHSTYDLARDFNAVSFLGSTPVLLAVTPSLPIHSVADLIALARAKPGTLNYASGGNGSSAHLTTELFKTMANVNLVHITYKGAGGGLNEVISGQVQLMFSSLTSLLPHVNSGRLRGIAMASAQRVAIVSTLPTIAEGGLPGFESSLWNAVMVPAGTPQTLIERLNSAIDRIMRNPEVIDHLRRQGFNATSKTRPEIQAYIKAEISKWAGVVKTAGIHTD